MGYFKPDIVTLTFQSFILHHLLNTQAMTTLPHDELLNTQRRPASSRKKMVMSISEVLASMGYYDLVSDICITI
jgi:hypothetical protein